MQVKVFYDGYYFTEETIGGISRMWKELLVRLASDSNFEAVIDIRNRRCKNYTLDFLLDKGFNNIRFTHQFSTGISVFDDNCILKGVLLNLKLRSMKLKDFIFHSTCYSAPLIRQGIRNVVTVHDLSWFIFSKIYPDNFYINNLRRNLYFSLHRADKVIVVSNSVKDDVLRLFPKIRPNRIEVIHHGLSRVFLNSKEKAEKKTYPYRHFLFVGGRNYNKNFDIVLKALSKVIKKCEDIKLILVGPDMSKDKKREEQSYLDYQGLTDYVVDLGMADDSELVDLYKGALALIIPSFGEGFGFPILEALACGCRVIASDIRIFRELGKSFPIYFNPLDENELAEKMLQTIDNGAGEKEKDAGIAYVSQFSWDDSASKLMDIYRSLR